MSEATKCGLCGVELDDDSDPMTLDCGGDCWGCIGEIEYTMISGQERHPGVERDIAMGFRDAKGKVARRAGASAALGEPYGASSERQQGGAAGQAPATGTRDGLLTVALPSLGVGADLKWDGRALELMTFPEVIVRDEIIAMANQIHDKILEIRTRREDDYRGADHE